jgi:ubiquinone/menaquinone biosynthesis C-methylase UbiE
VLGDDLLAVLGDAVPRAPVSQALADDYIPSIAGGSVLDLGCGAGDSVVQFRDVNPSVRWVGVDVEASPEVALRRRTDAEFVTFDGVHLPFEDGSFDAVYCKQVLEHVRSPAPLLGEVARVLRPGGLLAGSTSQLEPFHSFSTWNYTPYGLKLLLEGAGLALEEVRPGVDSIALIVNRGVGMRRVTRRWWAVESPLNRVAGAFGRMRRLEPRQVNAIKLLLCGQFAFRARRA